ncbi:carbamoyl-phosphate synthase (glutamine-hydrolyzing) cpa2 [Terramyces sp. JEL0728]|nr:carbamoyl-phosphate synthase (glutamine-hydrolyzing) cpa2 [Terramyces sp. JEL0728]
MITRFNKRLVQLLNPSSAAKLNISSVPAVPNALVGFHEYVISCLAQPNKKHEPFRKARYSSIASQSTKYQNAANVNRVVVVGSGGLSIGQAGEFDYSGSQAIKALKEEFVETILVNPNIATVQTGRDLADVVYFLPIRPEYIEYVIEKEKPDGVLLTFGGQSALNCGIALYEQKVFEKHNVKVLGTPIRTLQITEDRDLFAKALKEIDIPVATSTAVNTVDDALEAAEKIGYPVIIRSAFALGGLGSGFASNSGELRNLAAKSLSLSPQILVERSMKGWKEVEYEVVRDADNNCITVCNMENFDPLGTHTGDSIVVAPSQTLTDEEYHMLRSAAIKIICHLGVVGECNVQYALNPYSLEYAVIEVNARLSRSSALASKATGYPLAFVAAKIALGNSLPDLRNAVTKNTTANFEPSLDYVVTKIPRWDLSKFQHVGRNVGPSMKSVGEVMAIGRTWEESLQKAVRMVDPKFDGFQAIEFDNLDEMLSQPTDQRLYAVGHALFNKGYSVDQIHDLTKIDKWFLHKLENIVEIQKEIETVQSKDVADVPKALMEKAKRAGFSDKQIGKTNGWSEMEVRDARKKHGIIPFVKRIDTLAAEFPADTNYLYTTYNASTHDVEFNDRGIMVLGSGVYRIGSSVEFDWCGVSCIRSLRKLGHRTIMLNYNPETVSTDFDECDRLYFEELSLERTLDIYELENASGCIVSVGGQLPQNIALKLFDSGVNVLGTSPVDVDRAENRQKFSQVLDEIGLDQPEWAELRTADEALEFAQRVSYPVLVRPSYVLSGAAMNVAHSAEDLKQYLALAADVSPEHPIVITKFIQGAQEIDVDAVASEGELLVYAVSQHVENAGVHSGDATLVLPPVYESEQSWSKGQLGLRGLTPKIVDEAKVIAEKVAKAFKITGPYNMQLILSRSLDNSDDFTLKVIECNLRASRSFPFVSKVLDINFIDVAAHALVKAPELKSVLPKEDLMKVQRNFKAVKCPVFSWTRLAGADPILGVEMASTGEIACFGKDLHEAYITSLLSNHNNFKKLPLTPGSTVLLSLDSLTDPKEAAYVADKLQSLGYTIKVDDEFSKKTLASLGVQSTLLTTEPLGDFLANTRRANQVFQELGIEAMFSFCQTRPRENTDLKYLIRSSSVSMGLGYLNDSKNALLFVDALEQYLNGNKLKSDAVKSNSEWFQ